MRSRTRFTPGKTITFAALLMGSVACGTGQERAEQEEQATFGEPRIEEREQTVTTEQEVTRTETVDTDIPTVRRVTEGADINRMNVEQFTAIGFPQDVAENIIRYREEYGEFDSVEDLRQVQGVTPQLYTSLSDRLAAGRG